MPRQYTTCCRHGIITSLTMKDLIARPCARHLDNRDCCYFCNLDAGRSVITPSIPADRNRLRTGGRDERATDRQTDVTGDVKTVHKQHATARSITSLTMTEPTARPCISSSMQMLRYAPGCRMVGEARSSAQTLSTAETATATAGIS